MKYPGLPREGPGEGFKSRFVHASSLPQLIQERLLVENLDLFPVLT